MRIYDAVFAGEHSGHYYFRDNFYADSGLIAAVVAAYALGLSGKLASLLADIQLTLAFRKLILKLKISKL